MLLSRGLCVFFCASALCLSTLARAEDLSVEGEQVLLSTLLPVLQGTELGELVVADAPLPGETRVVRKSDIQAALKANGRDAKGLVLPRSVRLTRRARSVGEQELEARVREAVAAQVAPCTVDGISRLPEVSLAAGAYEVETQASARRASGRVPLVVVIKQGERSQRISAQLELSCPAPVVQPGASVRAVYVSGPIRISVQATAHQAGRVGDEIRITNQTTKKQLRGRVVDAQTVEVLP